MSNLDLTADVIDSRDIIERISELETFEALDPDFGGDEATELADLRRIADQGSEVIEDWAHGATLVRDRHFSTYAAELWDDISDLPEATRQAWPLNCIDWEHAARELRYDYSCITIDGTDYWGLSG